MEFPYEIVFNNGNKIEVTQVAIDAIRQALENSQFHFSTITNDKNELSCLINVREISFIRKLKPQS